MILACASIVKARQNLGEDEIYTVGSIPTRPTNLRGGSEMKLSKFKKRLKEAVKIVKGWPTWRKCILGSSWGYK